MVTVLSVLHAMKNIVETEGGFFFTEGNFLRVGLCRIATRACTSAIGVELQVASSIQLFQNRLLWYWPLNSSGDAERYTALCFLVAMAEQGDL